MINNDPSLKPVYMTSEPNVSISLYEGDIRLEQSGRVSTIHASILLTWLPQTCIRFEPHDQISGYIGRAKLTIASLSLNCDVLISKESCRCIIRGQLVGRPAAIKTTTCDNALFHLPNFESKHRLHLNNDEWDVILSPIDNISDLTNCLDEQGGFGLTHVGRLKRIDGGQFDKDQALDKLDSLYYFLSFVRGLWCGPILPIGLTDDIVGWQVWDTPRLTPWKYVSSWFFTSEPQGINEAFNGYMEKWVDPFWNEPTKLAIHWYIEANIGSGGVEGSIVLIQAALEMLSWIYLIEAPDASKPCTINDFEEKWPASKKIETLLKSMGIPLTIPDQFTELQKALVELQKIDSNAKKFPFGSYIFTYIRNRITHAAEVNRAKLDSISFEARVEAKELGLWYVEMVLLRLFGFNGVYYMRFSRGSPADQIMRVPWDLEIEKILLEKAHYENGSLREKPILKSDLIRDAVEEGIKEWKVREVLRYLEIKGYISSVEGEVPDTGKYSLSKEGKSYLAKLANL